MKKLLTRSLSRMGRVESAASSLIVPTLVFEVASAWMRRFGFRTDPLPRIGASEKIAGSRRNGRSPGRFLSPPLLLTLLVFGVTAHGADFSPAVPAPHWAVDPHAVGEPLPSVGRSLFDFLVTVEKNGKREYDVPFPYAALIEHIERKLHGGTVPAQVKHVLIPLGRSLQRNAAAPDFFKFPRVVSAVDTEAESGGDTGMLLKDRVYIGFGERSAVLEIISYNEAAGRFEFQVVNDYRPGGAPRVAYADRAVCVSCHQNEALIFSRQNWDETNANPRIAALLKKEAGSFHGVAIERGVDVPFAIDEATNRANLFAVTQLQWRDGCGEGVEADRCRATAFGLALQYRLSGERAFDAQSRRAQQGLFDVLSSRWRTRWPGGLLIPDPDIPNRDPLAEVVRQGASAPPLIEALDEKGKKLLSQLVANTDVAAALEPLEPRAPLETWQVNDKLLVARYVRGLAEFISVGDAQRVDAQLSRSRSGTSVPARSAGANCTVTTRTLAKAESRIAFECDKPAGQADAFALRGRVYARDGRIVEGGVETLEIDDTVLNALEVSPESRLERTAGGWSLKLRLRQSQMSVRSAAGAALEDIVLSGRGALTDGATQPAAARATLRDDYIVVWNAIEAMLKNQVDVFGPKPFRRAVAMPALLTQLGARPGSWCCVDASGMPPIVDDRLAATK